MARAKTHLPGPVLLAVLLLPAVVLAKDDPPSSTQPQVVTSGNVACGSGSPVTCTTEVSSVTPLPVSVNVSNGQSTSAPQTYPVVGTITGSGGLSDPNTFLFFYGSFGQQPNDTFPSLAYVQGSPVSLTNSAQLTFANALASGATYYLLGTANDGLTGIYGAEGGGVLVAYSRGGDGFPDNVDSPDAGNFNGAQGGPVTITNAAGASLTVLGNGGGGPALTGIAGYSIGGTGAENKTGDTDYAGNGGDGGSVTVINDGLISMANTGGVETYGILALSEGGVGNNEKNYAIGDGGSGGTVTVTNAGSIVNSASNGIGIVAVSVGGGGGSSNAPAFFVGGHDTEGSGGGAGGDVTVTTQADSKITTHDSGALGILAQSVGGGGGNGANAAGIFVAVGGNGGNGGNGGSVTVDLANNGSGGITTTGDFASGVIAQSVGGGGGNGGFADTAGPIFSVAIGGAGGSGGAGSAVSVTNVATITTGGTGGNADTVAVGNSGSITTLGIRAYGILAQSIGGGGGLAGADPAGASINTYGDGAFGMLAQSIGGGGGFGGDSSLPIGSMRSNFLTANPISSDTINGGDITINLNGNIATSGSNAHGVFVQSVGGGGGTYGADGQLMVGNDPEAGVASYLGSGGAITIVQDSGTIATSGQGSIGIFAQSTGNDAGNQPSIDITVGGAVLGGSGPDAAGILTSGGSSGPAGANSITINAGGSISTQDGVDGLAIGSGYGLTSVVNNGTITGSIDLDVGGTSEGSVSGSGTQTSAAASTLAADTTPSVLLAAAPRGSIVNNGTLIAGLRIAAASVTNAGTFDVGGGSRIATTSIDGDFVQTATGELRLDVDSLTGTADRLEIAGTAEIAGRITPLAQSLLPGTMTVLTAETLTLSPTPLDNGGLVFDWQADNDGRQLTLSPAADFTPAGTSFSPNQAAAATHLQKIWDAGASERSAALFGAFASLTSPAQLRSALDSIAPASLSNDAIAQASASRAALGAMMSCPEFAGESVMLGDGRCLWAKVTAGYEDQDDSSDTGDYRVGRWTFRAGAQTPLAPDWFLGVTAAYSNSSADSDGSSWRSDGDGADVGAAVKYMPGQWQFAAALDLGYGWYDQRRSAVVGGLRQQLKSSPDVLTIAGRLRAAYQVPFERLYLKPYVDLDLIHSRVQSYQEHGGDLALDVRSQEHTSLELSPMLELGGRLDLARRTILRPYAAVGLTVPSDNSWNSKASLDSAPAGTDSFTTSTRSPSLYGNLDLGLQLYQGDSIDLKLEYGLRIGDGYTAQYGGGRVAYRF